MTNDEKIAISVLCRISKKILQQIKPLHIEHIATENWFDNETYDEHKAIGEKVEALWDKNRKIAKVLEYIKEYSDDAEK